MHTVKTHLHIISVIEQQPQHHLIIQSILNGAGEMCIVNQHKVAIDICSVR